MTTTLERPADSAGALYVKTPVTPEEVFAAFAVAAPPDWHPAVIRLAETLAHVSSKLDLFMECSGKDIRSGAADLVEVLISFLDHVGGDPEREPDDEGDDADDEPSLGSFDRMLDQGKAWRRQSLWAFPAVDGEQDDADDEPALGSLDAKDDQTAWAAGDRRDLEQDPAESGIGDHDGLGEQVGSQDWQQGAMA